MILAMLTNAGDMDDSVDDSCRHSNPFDGISKQVCPSSAQAVAHADKKAKPGQGKSRRFLSEVLEVPVLQIQHDLQEKLPF